MYKKAEFLEVLFKYSDENNADYKKEDIIDYKNLPEESILRIFAEFVVEKTTQDNNENKFDNFDFFLLNNDKPNAFACSYNGKSIIGIHTSLLENIEQRINSRINTLPELSQKILNGYINSGHSVPINIIMYQFAALFIYYHELAHLIQFKNEGVNKAKLERYNFHIGNYFDIILHVIELDADYFATYQLFVHIINYWNNLPMEFRNDNSLESILTAVTSSLFVLFNELSGGWKEWYLYDYSHPNPVVRVSYINQFLIDLAKFETSRYYGFEISNSKSMVDTLSLSMYLNSDTENETGLKKYLEYIFSHSDEIEKYLNNFIPKIASKLPYLIRNN